MSYNEEHILGLIYRSGFFMNYVPDSWPSNAIPSSDDFDSDPDSDDDMAPARRVRPRRSQSSPNAIPDLAQNASTTPDPPKPPKRPARIANINLATFWRLPGEVRMVVYSEILSERKYIAFQDYAAMVNNPPPALAASTTDRAHWLRMYDEMQHFLINMAEVDLMVSVTGTEDAMHVVNDQNVYNGLLHMIPNAIISVKGIETEHLNALSASVLTKLATLHAGDRVKSVVVKVWLVHHFPISAIANLKVLAKRTENIAAIFGKKLTFKMACAPGQNNLDTMNVAKLHGKKMEDLKELMVVLEKMELWVERSKQFQGMAAMPFLEEYQFDESEGLIVDEE